MVGEHTHVLDWDTPRLHAADEEAHAHRNDLTPEMVRADPRFTPDRTGNPFYAELVRCYTEPAADCLWATAIEGGIAG